MRGSGCGDGSSTRPPCHHASTARCGSPHRCGPSAARLPVLAPDRSPGTLGRHRQPGVGCGSTRDQSPRWAPELEPIRGTWLQPCTRETPVSGPDHTRLLTRASPALHASCTPFRASPRASRRPRTGTVTRLAASTVGHHRVVRNHRHAARSEAATCCDGPPMALARPRAHAPPTPPLARCSRSRSGPSGWTRAGSGPGLARALPASRVGRGALQLPESRPPRSRPTAHTATAAQDAACGCGGGVSSPYPGARAVGLADRHRHRALPGADAERTAGAVGDCPRL